MTEERQLQIPEAKGAGLALATALFLVVAGLSGASYGSDRTPSRSAAGPVISTAVVNDLSRPLRDVRSNPDPVSVGGHPTGAIPLRQVATGGATAGIQTVSGGSPMPAATTFPGISNKDNSSLGFLAVPPDANGDVGGNYYVQWVNMSFAVFNKNTGASIYGPVPGNTLWRGFPGACSTRNDGDPVVAYDPLASRWVMAQFATPSYPSPPFYYCVAVSRTSNPTGSWYRFQFQFKNTRGQNWLDDYAKIAVWPDAYYVTFNEFDASGVYKGQGVAALDRNSMLGGTSAHYVYFDLGAKPATSGLGGMLPASFEGQTPPPAGSPGYFMQMDSTANGYPQDQLELWDMKVNWSTPSKTTFTEDPASPLPVGPFDPAVCGTPLCIPQPGTSQKLDPLSDRLMYRLQYLNTPAGQSLVTNQTVDAGSGVAGVRWYQLGDTGTGWTVTDQGTYAPGTNGGTDNRWMGSAAADVSGDLAVGYSLSGKNTPSSVAYAGRLAGDPAGQLTQGESIMRAGGGSQTVSSGRWGDYSSMSLDPSDGCTFYYTQEYYAATTPQMWSTVIGHFRFPSCVPLPDTTPPSGVAITAPKSPLSTRLRVPVAWTASDPGSGVASYDVSYRQSSPTTPFGSSVPWQTGTPSTKATFEAGVGSTYCFSATATDGAGNSSAPSAERCVSTPVDDRSLSASAGWSRGTSRGYFERTWSSSEKKGATLSESGVTALRLAVVVTKCPSCGRLKVLWNGTTMRTFDLASAYRRTRRTLRLPVLASLQAGTVQLVVASSGKRVIVDGLLIGQA